MTPISVVQEVESLRGGLVWRLNVVKSCS